jgi:signal transduction histidine kinase
MIGISLKELLGPLYALNLPHIERALRGEEQQFEREIPDPANGPARYSQAHYIPHIVAGKVAGFCVLVADISQRKQAEEALRELQRELEARERLVALATLATGIAHEINNPLATVLGNLELALEDLEHGTLDTMTLRELLVNAREDAGRVRDIVQGMKLLARGDVTESERVDVAATIEESISLAANTLRYRARLIRDLERDACVVGNPAQLAQVFVNLLANAARALPEATPRRNEIRVAARREGDQIVIEVADNGRGIPAELQSKIFEPFSTATGMGLGLSICRSIVQGLGGKMSVTSQVGEGSVFRIALPAAAPVDPTPMPKAAPSAPPRSSAPAPGIRPRLLIVDDEQGIGTILKRVLAQDDYVVSVVQSGHAALAALGEQRFDLILCDLMMPEMSGEEVYLEVMRTRPEFARRFVFMTGGAFTPRGRQFLAELDTPVLDKPFQLATVRRLVKECLRAACSDAPSAQRNAAGAAD